MDNRVTSAKVIFDQLTQEYLIEFSPDLITQLGWKIGDEVEWIVNENEVILKRLPSHQTSGEVFEP